MCLNIRTQYKDVKGITNGMWADNFRCMFPDRIWKEVEDICTKVAEEDIVCYKIFRRHTWKYKTRNLTDKDKHNEDNEVKEVTEIEYITPFRSAIFELGKSYKEKIHDVKFLYNTERVNKNKEFRTNLTYGIYHSFVKLEDAIDLASNLYNPTPNVGINDYVIVKCIIPKGTVYYEGTFEGNQPSYGSKAIYFTDEIVWYEKKDKELEEIE